MHTNLNNEITGDDYRDEKASWSSHLILGFGILTILLATLDLILGGEAVTNLLADVVMMFR